MGKVRRYHPAERSQEAAMKTSIGNVAIHVSDLERSTEFYRDVLGLQVLNRIETPNVVEVIVGAEAGGSQLMLASRRQPPGNVDPDGGIYKIYLDTDDVEELYRRVERAGCQTVEPPKRLDSFPVTIAFVKDT